MRVSKYQPLTDHLKTLAEDEWTTTFSEIDNLLDTQLPPSARRFVGWWANKSGTPSPAWVKAGWKVADVDFTAEHIVFARMKPAQAALHTQQFGWRSPLEIAKAKLSRKIGVDASQIEITIRA